METIKGTVTREDIQSSQEHSRKKDTNKSGTELYGCVTHCPIARALYRMGYKTVNFLGYDSAKINGKVYDLNEKAYKTTIKRSMANINGTFLSSNPFNFTFTARENY